MRRRTPGRNSIIVTACVFPRLPHEEYGTLGGKKRYRDKDLDEVRAYMAMNPAATIDDVAMVCNMSNNQAQRLRQKVRA